MSSLATCGAEDVQRLTMEVPGRKIIGPAALELLVCIIVIADGVIAYRKSRLLALSVYNGVLLWRALYPQMSSPGS